jgi:hypothetical protein
VSEESPLIEVFGIKCKNCNSMAEHIVIDDDEGIIPLCGECLNDLIYLEGDICVVDFAIEDLEGWIREINNKIKYLNERYARLLKKIKEGMEEEK